MLQCINDNAYKLDLPGEYGVSASFNVSNLSPFDAGDNLRTNPFQEKENDATVTAQRHGLGEIQPACGIQRQYLKDPLSLPSGLVIRLRAKCYKKALDGLVQQEVGEIVDS